MIREFTNTEVLETFIEVVHNQWPVPLVEQATRTKLTPALHLIIKGTIEKLIKKASPDLSILVQVDSVQGYPYQPTGAFEPFFNPDPADAHFYVTREASPAFFKSEDGRILTTTNTDISIDYYYPSTWTLTPPRNEEMAIRRTMDEILFAWTIVSKTLLSTPIIRFDDEDEAAEAVFAFANTLLFTKVVSDSYYYKKDFLRRLVLIQKAIKGSQPASNKDLATILYPPNKKIGQLEVPVANILHNKITQYAEGYLSCYGQEKYENYYKVLEAFKLYELQGEGFAEKDITEYLLNHIGKLPPDFNDYNMHVIQNIITNDDYRKAHPPMITTNFKGFQFKDICPFTYGSRALTYIHFEKDFISHLEKTFKHLDIESAVGFVGRMDLPKDGEINDGYDIDPNLIDLNLFHFDSREGNDIMVQQKTKEKYKNHGLYKAERQAAFEAEEGTTVEVEHEPNDVDLFIDSLKQYEDIPNIEETIGSTLWHSSEEGNNSFIRGLSPWGPCSSSLLGD